MQIHSWYPLYFIFDRKSSPLVLYQSFGNMSVILDYSHLFQEPCRRFSCQEQLLHPHTTFIISSSYPHSFLKISRIRSVKQFPSPNQFGCFPTALHPADAHRRCLIRSHLRRGKYTPSKREPSRWRARSSAYPSLHIPPEDLHPPPEIFESPHCSPYSVRRPLSGR